ncbi:hypothetical protein [Aquimarina sp. I32.4]|uniref:hypothetical protein n=1 Tax=Aquimarina sp. I32.4 TaxID=2053903 RepID=UPI000CDF1607|nr:hypothetical protein [Aquimarina sp. I32.4]
MRYFLTNLRGFVLGFLLINFALYFFVAKPAIFEKYISNSRDISQYNRFLISDSHGALMGDIPDIHDIYNFSYKGDNYLDMYLKINFLVTKRKVNEKDILFLTIDNHTLSPYRSNSLNFNRNLIYSDFNYEIIESEYFKKDSIPAHKKYVKYLPFLDPDYGGFYVESLMPSLLVPDSEYTFADYTKQEQNEICEERFLVQFPSMVRDQGQFFYLNKIISLCKKYQLKLIGIRFPITKAYKETIKRYDYGALDILKKAGYPVLDFQDLFLERDDYFYDQDHLNSVGADLFCKELKKIDPNGI